MLLPTPLTTSGRIASGQVAWPHHSSGAVRSGHVADTAVASGNIASGAVAFQHLADSAARSGTVGSGQIASGHLASGLIAGIQEQIVLSGIELLSGSVGSGKLASGTVQGFFGATRHVASGTLGVFDFGSGAVPIGAIGSGAVVSGNIASGQIGISHLQSGLTTSGLYLSGSIGSGQIGSGHLTSGLLAPFAFSGQTQGSGAIGSGSVGGFFGTRQIASGTVGVSDFGSGAVVAGAVGSGAVLSGNIASGQIGINHLQSGLQLSGLVLSGGLGSGQVGVFHLQSGLTTSGLYLSGSIGSGQIGVFHLQSGLATSGLYLSGSIGSGQIGSGHLTSGLLAPFAYSGQQQGSGVIGSGTVGGFFGNREIASGTIGVFDFGSGAVVAGSVGSGAVRSGNVASGQIGNNHLANESVRSGAVQSGTLFAFHLQSGTIFPGPGIGVSIAESGITVTNLSGGVPALVSGQVGSGFIASGAVPGFFGPYRGIMSGTVGVFDFGSGAVVAGTVGSGAVRSGNVASGQIGPNHLADNSVRSGAIASGQVYDSALELLYVLYSGRSGNQVIYGGSTSGARLDVIGAIGGNGKLVLAGSPDSSGDVWFPNQTTFFLNATIDEGATLVASGKVQGSLAAGRHLASGTVGPFDLGSGAVRSGALASGQVGVNHLGATGTADNTTFLRGDMAWATPTATVGSGAIGSGLIASGAVPGFFGEYRGICSGTIGVDDFGSGAVVAGAVGSGAIRSGNVASGQLGQRHYASGSVQGRTTMFTVASGTFDGTELGSGSIVSGRIASGQLGAFHYASGSLVSGRFASGVVDTYQLASGAIVRASQFLTAIASGTAWNVITEEIISGVKAVQISTSGRLRIAMASVSGKYPAVGVVTDNVASGIAVNLYSYGLFQFSSGMADFSGYLGQQLFLGRSGQVVTASGSWNSGGLFRSGTWDYIQVLGTAVNSGAALVEVAAQEPMDDPRILKAWCVFDGGAFGVLDYFNVASISDGGTGVYTVTWGKAFLTTNYGVHVNAMRSGGASATNCQATPTGSTPWRPPATSVAIGVTTTADAALDAAWVAVSAWGNQTP